MTTIKLDKTATYHFVGIKGSGMSALAIILHDCGYKVQGSDKTEKFFTQVGLDKRGIKMYDMATADHLHEDLIIIKGNAFGYDVPEMVRAKELGLTAYTYHDFIGEWMKNYTSIAVSGCHGKTTTTGMLAHVLFGLAPTAYLIGDGTGLGKDDAQYFAFEACEYKEHFLAYYPDYAIITSLDFDHPDYYQSLDEIKTVFQKFAYNASKALIVLGESEFLRDGLQANVPIYKYGFSETLDVYAKNMQYNEEDTVFDVVAFGKELGTFYSPCYGKHNVLNMLSVITVLLLEGFESEAIKALLPSFSGVKRRFTQRKVNALDIIDDYAHHPAEIEATINATKQRYPKKRCVAIFQPHTASRTKSFLDEFATTLNMADEVYLVDIFGSAREDKADDVKLEDLATLIPKYKGEVTWEQYDALLNYGEGDVLLFMGAGDIDKLSGIFTDTYSRIQTNLF